VSYNYRHKQDHAPCNRIFRMCNRIFSAKESGLKKAMKFRPVWYDSKCFGVCD